MSRPCTVGQHSTGLSHSVLDPLRFPRSRNPLLLRCRSNSSISSSHRPPSPLPPPPPPTSPVDRRGVLALLAAASAAFPAAHAAPAIVAAPDEVAASATTAATSPPPPLPLLSETYTSSDGFSFDYPPGWVVAFDRSGAPGNGAVVGEGGADTGGVRSPNCQRLAQSTRSLPQACPHRPLLLFPLPSPCHPPLLLSPPLLCKRSGGRLPSPRHHLGVPHAAEQRCPDGGAGGSGGAAAAAG